MSENANTRKERYKGSVSLSDTGFEQSPVKAARVDLAEYTDFLSDIPKGHNHQKGTNLPDGAISVAKSRFSQAAALMGVGIKFVVVPAGSTIARQKGYNLPEGHSRLLVSVGEKRKASAPKGEGTAKAAKPASKGLAAAVKGS